jgi:hypothetical protein
MAILERPGKFRSDLLNDLAGNGLDGLSPAQVTD